MRKNLIPEIAKMLGVQLGEKFKVKDEDEQTYVFTDDGLKVTFGDDIELSHISINSAFVALVKGQDEIVKLPWKPKKDETFYTFGIHATEDKWVVVSCKWWGNVKNLALYKLGWIYRSQAEAEAALPAVAKEMEVSYEL